MMQVCKSSPAGLLSCSAAGCRHAAGRARCLRVTAAKQYNTIREKPRARGFVEEDNSGKSNIFGTEPRSLYTSSPTADRAARQGIGGQQGLLLLAACLAAVAVATFGVGRDTPQTLSQVTAAAEGKQSLSSLASSIQRSM